jgi:3-hydroxy-3-methylglutaryl CoA synthase
MIETAGIDDLNVYGSTLAVETAAIAACRGWSDKELNTVEFESRSLTPPYEDAVTLAVNAARPLIDTCGLDSIELLIVATESGVDYGKPLSSYVHRHLRLSSRCRNLEVKHACYAGTAAIQLATAWIRSGDAEGKRALVVMTDLARRHFGDPGEMTAGCGAVAVTIASDPRILEIEPGSGYACREVYDVARPTAAGEWADAVLSLAAYLDLVEEAWAGYRCATGIATGIDERFRYMLYHTPLISLIREAHRLLLETDCMELDGPAVVESFDRMVRPALGYARVLANIYSGSVYSLLAGLMDGEADLSPGTRIGICSYGSGSCAEIYGGVVMETARDAVRRHQIAAHLAERTTVDVSAYERLVKEAEVMLIARDYEPTLDFLPGHFERSYAGRDRLVLREIQNHHRQYVWARDLPS